MKKIPTYFMGKELELMVDLQYRSEETTEEGVLMTQTPLSFRGFLLDIDDDYLYLGDNDEEITKFVLRSRVVGADIVKDPDPFDDLPVNGRAN